MLVDIHQDIDEQYARRLRPGTRLGLLDPLLLIGMFQQYQLGMRAAKLMNMNRTMDAITRVPVPKSGSNWVGPPLWMPLNYSNVTKEIRDGLARVAKCDLDVKYASATWTLHRYRAVVMLRRYSRRVRLYWFDSNRELVVKQTLPFENYVFIEDAIAVPGLYGSHDIYRLCYA